MLASWLKLANVGGIRLAEENKLMYVQIAYMFIWIDCAIFMGGNNVLLQF